MKRVRFSMCLNVLVLCLFLAMPSFAAVETLTVDQVASLLEKKPEEGNYRLIDSRPEMKYFAGHLPWASSLPLPEMKDRLDELPQDKSTRLVFYCGGLKCDLSDKAAALAVENGYSNVSVFPEGEPGWAKSGRSLWVSTNYIKIVLNDPARVAQIIDARPPIKYNEGTVPGAMNLCFRQWEERKGLLPRDMNTQLIFFCGGHKCDLSHRSAEKARAMGYTDVRIYSEGWPAWKEQSTRAFAMVNPKQGGSAPAEAEAVVYEGEILKEELISLIEKQPADFVLVDVRPADEYEKAHLPGAINILDEKVPEHADQLKGKKVVFYCNAGSRSAVAYYGAEDAGIEDARFLNREVAFGADGSFEIK